jgi:hypothetical protein
MAPLKARSMGIENSVLVFANESHLSRFNPYMTKLDKVTTQQGAREKESTGPNKQLRRSTALGQTSTNLTCRWSLRRPG